MNKRVLSLIGVMILLSVMFSVGGFAGSVIFQNGSAAAGQGKQKNMREIAAERDIVVNRGAGSNTEYESVEALTAEATAIVYGQITDAKSFFEESGHPLERGENITTEYSLNVDRVLKDTTLNNPLPPNLPSPAPLVTPLKIAREGGVVYLNGHRAEVKYDGYESLSPGKRYVFFLFWSPDYKAYVLAGGISGAVLVNSDLSLKPLATSTAIKSTLSATNLDMLSKRISNSN